jgi:hypothetical protein
MAGESKLQTKIRERLEKSGWLVVKIKLCTKNGWPDLELLKNGHTVYLEIKDEGEDLDPLQVYRHQEIKDHGGEVHTVDTFDEFLKLKLC